MKTSSNNSRVQHKSPKGAVQTALRSTLVIKILENQRFGAYDGLKNSNKV